MIQAAKNLAAKGADCIILGCAGMTDMKLACEQALQEDLWAEKNGFRTPLMLDGVGLGIQFLIGFKREGLKGAHFGIFRYSVVARRARGQNWL